MFNNNTDAKNKSRKGASSGDYGVNILTTGCSFSGKLYCKGSSRIAGRIDGEIISEGFLVIEEEAHIQANIVADSIIIHGYVNGVVTAKQKVELSETAHFEGDIASPSLIVKEGAQFNGRATMSKTIEVQASPKFIEERGEIPLDQVAVN